MLLGSIATQPIGGYLELLCSITKAHKPNNPEEYANSLGTDVFDGSDVHRLAIITKPITEVDTFDIKLAELLPACSAGHENVEESIFNVAMAPILTFNAGYGGYGLSAMAVMVCRQNFDLPMLPAPKANVGTDRNAKTIAADRKKLKHGDGDGIRKYVHCQAGVKCMDNSF